METRVGIIEETVKEIKEHLAQTKEELVENQKHIKDVQESFDVKIDTVVEKLTDVYNIVSHLQNTILFVLASGSLFGAVIIFVAAAALGF